MGRPRSRDIFFKVSRPRLSLRRPSASDMKSVGLDIIYHIRKSNASGLGVDGLKHRGYTERDTLIPTRAYEAKFGKLEKPIKFPRPKGPGKIFRYYAGYAAYKKEVTGDARVNHRLTGRMLEGLFQKSKSVRANTSVAVTTKNDVDKRIGAMLQIEFDRYWFGIGILRAALANKVRGFFKIIAGLGGRAK